MNRESFILYRYAESEKQAKLLSVKEVAKKHEVLPVVVNMYIKDHPDCYKITKEIEFNEVDNGKC